MTKNPYPRKCSIEADGIQLSAERDVEGRPYKMKLSMTGPTGLTMSTLVDDRDLSRFARELESMTRLQPDRNFKKGTNDENSDPSTA